MSQPLDPGNIDICEECGNPIILIREQRSSRTREVWRHLTDKGKSKGQLTGRLRYVYTTKKCPGTSRPEASPSGEAVVE